MTILGRPLATLVLAVIAALASISALVVALQFAGVIDQGADLLDFWGGKWAGIFLFGALAAISLIVAFGWLTLRPWAPPITFLMALLGISIPVMALLANTETWSTALAPIVLNGLVLVLVMLPNVRHAVRAGVQQPKKPVKATQPVPALRSDQV